MYYFRFIGKTFNKSPSHYAFDISLNEENNYRAGVKQLGINLRVWS